MKTPSPHKSGAHIGSETERWRRRHSSRGALFTARKTAEVRGSSSVLRLSRACKGRLGHRKIIPSRRSSRPTHDGKQARGELALFCHSPCASLADPPKLPPRRSRLGLRMRMGASRTCRCPTPSGHPPGSQARPRRAAHPLPRCARSRHCRRPPRSPPLCAAGAHPGWRLGVRRGEHDSVRTGSKKEGVDDRR